MRIPHAEIAAIFEDLEARAARDPNGLTPAARETTLAILAFERGARCALAGTYTTTPTRKDR